MRNALHTGEDEVTTSVANAASQLKQDHRTPLITTNKYNELLATGKLIQISGKGSHTANIRMPDGTTVPVYSTRIRENDRNRGSDVSRRRANQRQLRRSAR